MSIVVLVDNGQCTFAIIHLSLGGHMTIIDTPTAIGLRYGRGKECVRFDRNCDQSTYFKGCGIFGKGLLD